MTSLRALSVAIAATSCIAGRLEAQASVSVDQHDTLQAPGAQYRASGLA